MAEYGKPRIAHVTSGLLRGGAETFLTRVASATRDEFEHVIYPLRSGPMAEPARGAGATVSEAPATLGPFRLAANWINAAMRMRSRAALLQGWMYNGNIMATLFSSGTPVLWNIRHTLDNTAAENLRTRAAIRLSLAISGRPDGIIYNARRGAVTHEAYGYPAEKRLIIPNGFDTDCFRPDPHWRAEARAGLGLTEADTLVGRFCRNDSMKDHATLFDAFRRILDGMPNARLALAGYGMTQADKKLAGDARRAGVHERVLFLGERDDIPRLMTAVDLMLSTSNRGEGFPNVIGEAMSCGVPVVATDAGDSAEIIADPSYVCRIGDAEAIAARASAILSETAEARVKRGAALRQRIVESYSLDEAARQYASLWRRVIRERRKGSTV